MKKTLIIGSVVLVTLFLCVLWLTNTFTLFEVEEETLASHSLARKGFNIEIKRVAAGATTSDVIQVRKVFPDGRYEVIETIDSYNTLISSTVMNDSVLRFIVKDSGYANNEPDTVEVRFK